MLLGGSMEFLERINELRCCNNRITIEISQTENARYAAV